MRTILLAVLVLASGCARAEDAPKPGGAGSATGSGSAAGATAGDPFLTFDTTAPTVGQIAPPFELTAISGGRVNLDTAVKSGPVVLVFASFTCPPSRMKLPGFEQLAVRWKGKAQVFVVYTREAHPLARSSQRLNGFADQVYARDADGDQIVTLAEYGDMAERYMFDAFDLDHDGAVRSYELLAARRLDQFKEVTAPATLEDRIAIATRLRSEVPGELPILVDGMDDAVATGYGGLPNMAYVIGADRKVTFKIPWAAVADVERELARLTGVPPPPAPPAAPPDLAIVKTPLAEAAAAKRPLLLELTAIGCRACETMAKTLADPALATDLARYHVTQLGIERDDAWRLFESLGLGGTPSLVAMTADGKILGTLQGARDRVAVQTFLRAHTP